MVLTKEYLRQYRDIEKEMKQLEEQIQKLEADVYTVKSVLIDGMPKQQGVSDCTRIIDKLMDAKQLYAQKWDELIDMKTEIEKAITSLPSLERRLIRLYYFEGLSWENVCCEIGYAWRQTHRIHAKALNSLKMAHNGTQICDIV